MTSLVNVRWRFFQPTFYNRFIVHHDAPSEQLSTQVQILAKQHYKWQPNFETSRKQEALQENGVSIIFVAGAPVVLTILIDWIQLPF